MVICLERSADLHMALLMPLPLTTRVVPDKGPLNGCMYVCMLTAEAVGAFLLLSDLRIWMYYIVYHI